MRDRLLTLAGGIAAILLVIGIFSSGAPDPGGKRSLPNSQDHGDAGYAGLYRWLSTSGIPLHSLRHRYTHLQQAGLSETGNLLIIVLPQSIEMRFREREALQDWLRQGNSLLLMLRADIASLPSFGEQTIGLLANLGLAPHWESDEPDETKDDAGQIEKEDQDTHTEKMSSTVLKPKIQHPLLDGIREVRLADTVAPCHCLHFDQLENNGESVLLPLLSGKSPAVLALVAPTHSSWLGLHAEMFANASLGLADNAQLAANLVQTSLGPGGSVIFDDLHQGLSNLYDPDAFFSDSRLHASLGLLLAGWLVYLVGFSNRFGPLQVPRRPVSQADYLETAAGFYPRSLNTVMLTQRLQQQFDRRMCQLYRCAEAGAARQMLQHDPRVPGPLIEALNESEERLQRLGRADPVSYHNLTLKVEEALS